MKSVNPQNGQLIQTYEPDSPNTVQFKIARSHSAQFSWKQKPVGERVQLAWSLAQNLRARKEELADLAVAEMGKPLSQAIAEVEKCAWLCEHYADHAAAYLSDERIETDAAQSWVSFEPLGVILGIMPWNFPFWQVIRFAVPTVLAGNTVVVKHASNVQGCAGLLEEIFEASSETKVYQNLRIAGSEMTDIIAHPDIKAVSLTGSEGAGRSVAAAAGKALKPSLLELGGSNPFIVWADANLDSTLETLVKARIQNNGQSCIAAKRLIIAESIAEAFIPRLVERFESLKMGDPSKKETDVGPLASTSFAEDLENQLKESVALGATVVCGGTREGAFFTPCIVTDVRPGMPIFDRETFGPLLAVSVVQSPEESIALANQSAYGLGATICTQNMDLARKLGKELKDGAVFINELVKSDPRLPFGGTDISGYGRELGREGILAFVNKKTYVIR